MRFVDSIEKKEDGGKLTKEEIQSMVTGYVDGSIPDYQMSAMMMAILLKGMDAEEATELTMAMMHSGDVVDLSDLPGVKLDKHSTGGVGDTTTLVVAPLVAACGGTVAKMSGRGLGHTGGTLDKLESVPGTCIEQPMDRFKEIVRQNGVCVIGQSGNLVPADKKMYALRDVTGTVQSIPLIASSIMSKKLAAGSDAILLDVKYGDGAFMKNLEDAKKLARTMITIGQHLHKDTRATISNMSQPLGYAIGNSLEVKEAIATLNGNGPEDLLELCLTAGSTMLMMAQKAETVTEARKMLEDAISSKKALHTLEAMVKEQGGDSDYILYPEKFTVAEHIFDVYAPEAGYIEDLEALTLGLVSMRLGGGRETVTDEIDHSVGLILHKKIGDYVEQGEPLVTVHDNGKWTQERKEELLSAFHFNKEKVEKPILIDEIME